MLNCSTLVKPEVAVCMCVILYFSFIFFSLFFSISFLSFVCHHDNCVRFWWHIYIVGPGVVAYTIVQNSSILFTQFTVEHCHRRRYIIIISRIVLLYCSNANTYARDWNFRFDSVGQWARTSAVCQRKRTDWEVHCSNTTHGYLWLLPFIFTLNVSHSENFLKRHTKAIVILYTPNSSAAMFVNYILCNECACVQRTLCSSLCGFWLEI